MIKQFHHVRGAVRSQVQATVRYRAVREKHAECGGTALKFYCRIKSFSVLSLTNRPSSGATKLKFVYEPALSFFFCLLKFFQLIPSKQMLRINVIASAVGPKKTILQSSRYWNSAHRNPICCNSTIIYYKIFTQFKHKIKIITNFQFIIKPKIIRAIIIDMC